MEVFKVCKSCGEEKFIQNFVFNRSIKSGYTNICKKCNNRKMAERYACIKDELKAKRKAEREAKKEADRQRFEDIKNGRINFDH